MRRRMQKGRFPTEEEWEKTNDIYWVDPSAVSQAKEDMIPVYPCQEQTVQGKNQSQWQFCVSGVPVR